MYSKHDWYQWNYSQSERSRYRVLLVRTLILIRPLILYKPKCFHNASCHIKKRQKNIQQHYNEILTTSVMIFVIGCKIRFCENCFKSIVMFLYGERRLYHLNKNH